MKNFYNNDFIDDIEACITNREYEIALLKTKEYIKEYPKDKLGPIYLARCKELNNIQENIIEDCESVINSKLHNTSSYVIAYTWYGNILKDLGFINEAIEKLKKAIEFEELDKKQFSIKARINLANIYIDLNEPFEAIKLLKNIKANKSYILLNKLTYVYITINNYKEACKTLNKINENEIPDIKNKQQYYINKGRILIYKKKYEEAIVCLKKSLLMRNSYYNQAIKLLAHAYSNQNEYNKAIKYGIMLLNTKKYAFDANIILGKSYLKKGLIKESYFYINNLTDDNIKNYYLSLIKYSEGNFKEAKQLSEHLLNTTTDERTTTILNQVINSYIRENEIEKAYYVFKNVKNDLETPTIEQLTAFFYKYYNKDLEEELNYYSAKQLYKYDEDLAIDHIYGRHHIEGENSYFGNKERIIELYNEVKKDILDLKPKYEYLFNKYIYIKDNLTDRENDNNRLVVVTLPNSNNIITMYPLEGDEIYAVDEVKELKRESQIDKFYKRYGKR